MVAPDHVPGPAPDPIETGCRLQGVIDHISETDAYVMRLINYLQGRPVGMDVGHHEYTHTRSPPQKGTNLLDAVALFGVYPNKGRSRGLGGAICAGKGR